MTASAKVRRLDGPTLRHPLGAYLEYRNDPLTLFYEQAVAHGGSVRLRLAHQHVHLLVEPEHINQVLVGNATKYAKGISYQSLNYLLGPGLLTSGGELWKRQRALIKPAFARRHVETEIPLMVACGERMLTRLDALAAHGEVFDLVPEMMGFAADVVCRAVMGADIDGVLPQIEDDVREGVSWVMGHMAAPVQLPPSVPTPANRRFNGVRARLHRVVDDVVHKHRQAESTDTTSLLARLLAARDDAGHAMDDEQLRHEVLTFLLAGHETTGGAMAWTIYELCRNPLVLGKIRAEIDTVLKASTDRGSESNHAARAGGPSGVSSADGLAGVDGVGGASVVSGLGGSGAELGVDGPSGADRVGGIFAHTLPSLELTGHAIDEAMRLHPPAWAFSRTVLERDSFDRFDLEPGSIVVISPFVNHRWPEFWDSPLTFDPDRFTKERSKARSPFHYFPFGWGAHLCVGQHMALMEVRVGIAMLLSRYDIELVNGIRVRENPEISNTPDPVLVRLTRRKSSVPIAKTMQEAAQ
ncbi:cytochrome P450 [Nocardia sp. NBC_01009]|uniref:cytochrome P450 n=1 Tax=Nocardia sp. NBC_01009 TaxID=2975996 RepID=UPI00386A8A6C|nr:cytochrome P450 [Nocardia sp. NBC_01009]